MHKDTRMFSLFKKIIFVWAFIGLAFSANAQSIYADQQTNSASQTCLACGVVDPDLAVDGDQSTASSIGTTLGLLGGSVEQTLIFPVTGQPGDTVEIMMESGEMLLSLDVLGNVGVTSFNGATSNGDTKIASDLSVSAIGSSKFIFTFYPTATYDRVQVNMNVPVLGLVDSLKIYFARIYKESDKSGLTSCTPPDAVSSVINCPLLGTLLSTCAVSNVGALLSVDPTDFATITLQADLTASGGIGVSYNTPTCSNDSVSIYLERPDRKSVV